MRTLILASDSCMLSARLVRDVIERQSGTRYLITKDKTKINVLFRYGNLMEVEGTDGLNRKSFIELVCNKDRFSLFAQENGFYSPYFYRGGSPACYPAIIRTTLTASGGVGIIVVQNEDEYKKHWKRTYWWTPYVPTEFELRVHVLGGEVAKVFRKNRADGLEPEPYPIRNNSNGYHFSVREEEKYPKISELIGRLHPLLEEQYGGSFYAVDVGWDSKKKEYFIYEINSAPGLNEQTAELYAQFILSKV